MRGDALDGEGGEFFDLSEAGGDICGEEATACHAGIDGDVNGEGDATAGGDGGEGSCFGEGGDAGGDVASDDFLALKLPCGSEEVDGGFYPGIADAACLANVGNTEELNALRFEETGDGFEAVTVGTCFDDGHDGAAGGLAGDAEVVGEGGGVDLDP